MTFETAPGEDQDADGGDVLVSSRSSRIGGIARLPGDKSISHRALILAAMAKGTTRINGLSDALDVEHTRMALAALGAETWQSEDYWFVRGGPWHTPPEPIDCGNSGTTARLLLGALAGMGTKAVLMGDASLSRRPMARVAGPLRAMGAKIDGGDTLPLVLDDGVLRTCRHINRPASAQVKSALLLAGLGSGVVVEIVEPSPTRDHLERLLPAFGVAVEQGMTAEGLVVRLSAQAQLTPADIDVPGDVSAAAFPLIAALICPDSEIHMAGVGVSPGRTGLLDTLEEMGASLALTSTRTNGHEPVADIAARSSRLRGVTVPGDRAPRMIDEYPILAVAAACAEGETVMHGLAELRVKESDRLAALADGLAACGVDVRIEADTLRLTGGPVHGGVTVRARGDHRIAMAFLVLGLVSEAPIRVDSADMIATSFPGFAAMMCGLGARIAAP